MASSLPVKGFDGSKDLFVGKWRSEQNPEAIEAGESYNSEITSGDAVFSLQSEITLEPREEIVFPVIMGIVPTDTPIETIADVVDTYRDNNKIHDELVLLKENQTNTGTY